MLLINVQHVVNFFKSPLNEVNINGKTHLSYKWLFFFDKSSSVHMQPF